MSGVDILPSPAAVPSRREGRGRVLLAGAVIGLAALALQLPAVLQPMLLMDDFQILAQSWTWREAWANLWTPANEHSMPLGRLSTWLLVRLAGRLGNVPLVFALQGPLALLAGMGLVYAFVRREVGRAAPALLAAALFGVTTRYQEGVVWFAASFALLALNTLLLELLAAQRWLQTGRYRHLALSALGAALAPGWFGSGVLAGPLGTLYLLGPSGCSGGLRPPLRAGRWRGLAALAPSLGTALSLAVTLPHNAERILNLRRVEVEATAWQTFDPRVGLSYTARALVDDLVPGALGLPPFASPPWIVLAGWVVLGVAAAWWWRHSPHRRLLLLGAGLAFSGYLLIFTARAYFDYEQAHASGRYHLLAHLGLVLFLCGGPLPWGTSGPAWKWGPLLLALLVASQLPRCTHLAQDPQQAADLRRIEEVDALCRRHRISADTARQVLPPFDIAGCYEREVNGRVLSGWDFLHGSDDPRPVSAAEARRLLNPEAAGPEGQPGR